MELHYQISVQGKVQGVGFRAFTEKTAQALGVKGFVQNQSDGSVYIEAEANEVILKEFLRRCQQGPSYARVDQLKYKPGTLKNYTDFQVIY